MPPAKKKTKAKGKAKARKTAKRTPARKTAKRKAPARKTAKRKAAPKTRAKAKAKTTKAKAKGKKETFTTADLVEHILKSNEDLTKTQARKIVSDAIDGIHRGLKRHDKVRITGMGTYTKKRIPAKRGGKKMFMPALGREVITKAKPAQTKIRFRPSKDFKQL